MVGGRDGRQWKEKGEKCILDVPGGRGRGKGGGTQVKVGSWYMYVEEEDSQTGGCVAMETHW